MDVVKIDFPDRDLYILKDGDWRGYRSKACEKEPETVEWIRSFDEGSVLWDVGASVGPYSLIAAALGHQVVALEPFAPSYGHLWQNIWLNSKHGSVVALPFGLSSQDTPPSRIIRCSSAAPGSASHGSGDFEQVFLFTSADDLADRVPPPNHVKIDVDGAELGVIEGGRVLWKQVDSIMVESEVPVIDDITLILGGAGLEMVNSWKRIAETKQHNYEFRRA